MTFEEFQHLARLSVVGALDEAEMEQFRCGRALFKGRAEMFIVECQELNAVFALSLRPMEVSPGLKIKLMERIKTVPCREPKVRVPSMGRSRGFRPVALPAERRSAGRM